MAALSYFLALWSQVQFQRMEVKGTKEQVLSIHSRTSLARLFSLTKISASAGQTAGLSPKQPG